MQEDQSLLRTQHIIEHLESLWRFPQEPSPEILKQITEFAVSLEEPYKTICLQQIAEHAVNNMNLHILALMATFKQNAEQDGISSRERDEVLSRVIAQTLPILNTLSKLPSIHSLDDLVALSNITVGLQSISRTKSALEAQSWLYELPTMYYRQLAQENLIINIANNLREISKVRISSHFITWASYSSAGPSYILAGTGETGVFIANEKSISPIEVPIIARGGYAFVG